MANMANALNQIGELKEQERKKKKQDDLMKLYSDAHKKQSTLKTMYTRYGMDFNLEEMKQKIKNKDAP